MTVGARGCPAAAARPGEDRDDDYQQGEPSDRHQTARAACTSALGLPRPQTLFMRGVHLDVRERCVSV